MPGKSGGFKRTMTTAEKHRLAVVMATRDVEHYADQVLDELGDRERGLPVRPGLITTMYSNLERVASNTLLLAIRQYKESDDDIAVR